MAYLLLWLAAALPLGVLAQSNTTTSTNTTSNSVWNASGWGTFVAVNVYIGPQTIAVGNLGTCTLTLPYNCAPSSGSGTQADPYLCATPPVVTGCTSGTPFVIAPGGMNIDTHVYYLQPAAAPAAATPVPLSPWVPFASAIGALLVALLWRRRSPMH
jgi:hypothetical protein